MPPPQLQDVQALPAPILLLNCVGLTPRLLPHAPRLAQAAEWVVDLQEVIPAVTCTAQATLLTGQLPCQHGIVANGWLYSDTMEVRFWQQSNRLLQAEPLYATLKRRKPGCKIAKLFWWFNQGAAVDISLTPKPWYGLDGGKVFDIAGTPDGLAARLKAAHGDFPFAAFWGPRAGLASTRWIAAAAATVLRDERPDLTLVYLPHLDYDPQRYGPAGCDMTRCVRELDEACSPLLDAASALGAKVWLVSEYGHADVTDCLLPNLLLRQAGFLRVRSGPFGEQLDLFNSRAFAVVDHQIAHVYVADAADLPRVRDCLAALPHLDHMLAGAERGPLDHPRSGTLILLPRPGAWFAYNFWLDARHAPDYARCVAIHHKPGFDPCELFIDPQLRFPRVRLAWRMLQQALGFRTRFDVVPLDPMIVRGSHGLPARDPLDRPLLAGHGPNPGRSLPMTAVRDLILHACETD